MHESCQQPSPGFLFLSSDCGAGKSPAADECPFLVARSLGVPEVASQQGQSCISVFFREN